MPELFKPGQAGALPQKNHYPYITAAMLLLASSANVAAKPDPVTDPIETTRAALRAAIQYSSASAKPLPFSRQETLRQPVIADVKLAPDGRFLSFRQRKEQQTDLLLRDLATGQHKRVLADVSGLETAWSGDGRRLWLADKSGLAIYELSTSIAKRILKWDDKRQQRFWGVDAQASSHALIRERVEQNGAWRYRVLLVDTNGKTTLLHEAEQSLRGVLLKADGSLAYTAAYEGSQFDTVVRQHLASGAHEILRCLGAEQCGLIGHSETKNALWLLSHHNEDKLALQRWQQGRWQTLHRDPAGIADTAAMLWNPQAQDWLATAYHPDRRHWYGRDATTSAQLLTLQQQLPDASLELTTNNANTQWLVRAKHATWQQDRYYLYRLQEKHLQLLFAKEQADTPSFPAEHLVSATPLHYRARDGLLVHGYVYLPRGVTAGKAPLIAHIHGGPFNRDRDHFDAINQLLVNRGYAVFTPNFRASTGYGQRYLKAPQGDFGNSGVLNDILDGLDFLLAEGVGDREKQAVIGHSFGGYASLLAVSHHPDRFRFAVASAAPVDFNWVMQEIIENGGSALPEDGPRGAMYLSHYGLRFGDAMLQQKMSRESPLAKLAQLQTPIYLWAGAKDDRVPLKSLSHYAGEAKRLNKEVSILIDPDSGHSPETALNLEALVYLLESAGATHFGGELTAPSAQLQAFLLKNLRLK